MALRIISALLFVLLLAAAELQAQTSRRKHQKQRKTATTSASYFSTPEDWFRQAQGKPFPLQGSYPLIGGGTIDFTHLQRPIVVCLGFAACPPCRHELPIYRAAAHDHPEIDFVYITYDDEPTRLKELAEVGDSTVQAANYHVMHLSLQEIDRHSLTLAYPTQYFIGADGLVRYMHSGGDPDEPEAAIRARIERIISGD